MSSIKFYKSYVFIGCPVKTTYLRSLFPHKVQITKELRAAKAEPAAACRAQWSPISLLWKTRGLSTMCMRHHYQLSACLAPVTAKRQQSHKMETATVSSEHKISAELADCGHNRAVMWRMDANRRGPLWPLCLRWKALLWLFYFLT